uniref:epithelial cell-transforming sequence 2 oncogene-like isoform X2 n=1 Tax=Doryrhamphus excisus TaxID=161450 RepID=UPI0025AEBF91|nr:epithelial cell-transforming sequence 2 oncogene-like isoform X2 [Doryrhamphus excisus]
MENNPNAKLDSVKLWKLGGPDQDTRRRPSDTRFSCWTPLMNQTSNKQLFEERTTLVLHWFDLWTDGQRKHLLHSLLTRCTKPQLRYCRDLLIETLPVTQVDLTAVLPRFLSLYIMSFLSPLDLCFAAQVSWHWRFLSEQDCLWAGRCMRQGWFLPYTPGEKEFGAWKNHYITCVNTLDRLTPREAAQQYGTLNQPFDELAEEVEERLKERMVRQIIREMIQEKKRTSLATREAWSSSTKLGKPGGGSLQSRTSWSLTTSAPPDFRPSKSRGLSSERVVTSNRASGQLSTFTSTPARLQGPPPHPGVRLLLISNRIPAYELVLSGTRPEVVVVLYDHRGTLSALLSQVERAVSGRTVQRLGLLAPEEGTEGIHLFHNICLSDKTLLTPSHREFWEKLCTLMAPAEQGASGVALMKTLATLTGLKVWAPMGLATGSFQNILSEWSDGSIGASGLSDLQPGGLALQYISVQVLQGWCRQTLWMEEALGEMRRCLEPRLQEASLQARCRALGHSLWEKVCLEDLCLSEDLTQALTEGLTALSKQEDTRHLEFLATFLTSWKHANQTDDVSVMRAPPQVQSDWRGVVARELHHSERLYISRLEALVKAYQEPLTAALNSNRAILSSADVHVVLSPIAQILDLNRRFQADLENRLQHWGAEQCVGDVCLELCTQLRVYTNYLNNYTTALSTIDKCRESKPAFRAFLKRTDRTLTTHMLSLQELLLCPVWRIQEYTTLLQALTVHTHTSHPDHIYLSSARDTLQRYMQFIQKLKRNCEQDGLLEDTQRMIQGCPSLREGSRQLVTTQDAAMVQSPNEDIPESLRTYEHVADIGLFLFTDALVMTRRQKRHTPFTVAHRSTHTFMASVELTSLAVRKLSHSRYVSHAFVLEGPCRSWVCATENGEEMEHFLCMLRSTMQTALAMT